MAPVYKQLPRTYDGERLFKFLFDHGQNEWNYCPEDACRQHFAALAAGATLAWAGFDEPDQSRTVGFVTARVQDSYLEHQGPGAAGHCAEICEYTVHPDCRGKGVGTTLARAAATGLFQDHAGVNQVVVVIHHENVPSKKSFLSAGFSELATFEEPQKNRTSTLLIYKRADWEAKWKVDAGYTRVLGIQSGNAIDGIDAVVVDFAPPQLAKTLPPSVDGLAYKVVGFRGTAWDPEVRTQIFAIRTGEARKLVDIVRLHQRSAECFAEACESLLVSLGVPRATVALISSHGQTIHGHPHWEIGEPAFLAERLGITTVADFRAGDMAAGGNGSPCTCTFDSMMLRPKEGDKWRVAINIGGTSSMTFCPPIGSEAPVSGLDPGLGVLFYDWAVRDFDPALEYDDDGALARAGTVHEGLLAEMMQLPHFVRDELPISVGPDDFPRSKFDAFAAKATALGLGPNDFFASLVELTTRTIANAAGRFCPTKNVLPEVVVRGGVRYNSFFIERLRTHLTSNLGVPVKILPISDPIFGLGDDADETWETVLYSMLGFLCASNLPNFVPSTTGARRAVSGGKICLAPGHRGVLN